MAPGTGNCTATDPRRISLVGQTNPDLPPLTARPLAALSLLEHALVAQDVPAVESLLHHGADPTLVCGVRLRTAAGGDENGAACACLVQVASRMKRMHLAAPIARTSATPAAASPPASGTPAGPIMRFFGRFATRHSIGTPPVPDGPITQALRAYDLLAAKHALEKAGGPPAKFDFKRDQDRLIGMLVLNDTERLDAWHERGLLNPSLQPAHRPGLKTALKQFSYVAGKPRRGRFRSHNGAFKFHGTRVDVVCRHLAAYWLLHRPLLANGKIDYAAFRSKKLLKKAFKGENQHAFDYYVNNCTNSHLVRNSKWGEFLATQFRAMLLADSGCEPKRLLICSDNHAMACELKIKKGADGLPVYALNFYDPNSTASHRRVRTQDLASIESLSMAKLINDKHRNTRYYENQSLSLAFIIPDDMPRITQADALLRGKENIVNRQLSSRPAVRPLQVPTADAKVPTAQNGSPVDASYVYQMLKMGFSGEMPHVFAEVAKMPNTRTQVDVLCARLRQGGSPLVSAMTLGFENTVCNYTRGVLALTTLSGDQKAKVLSQSTQTGPATYATGLQAAFKAKRASVVDSFTRLVLACDALSADQKLLVLRLKKDDERQAQRQPEVAHRKSVKAFIDAVNQSDVAPELRARLLHGI